MSAPHLLQNIVPLAGAPHLLQNLAPAGVALAGGAAETGAAGCAAGLAASRVSAPHFTQNIPLTGAPHLLQKLAMTRILLSLGKASAPFYSFVRLSVFRMRVSKLRPAAYGSTLYSADIPASMWSSMWQWNIHVPGLSGTISTVTICAGRSETTSVRFPSCNTTLPCQCGV